VAPELLADPDSQFVTIQGVTVHYKEAWPETVSTAALADANGGAAAAAEAGSSTQAAAAAAWMMPASFATENNAAAAAGVVQDPEQTAAAEGCAIVLVHGFGGGTFAWRQVLQPLATAAGMRVVAFDRTGFGKSGGLLQTRVSTAVSQLPAVQCCSGWRVCCCRVQLMVSDSKHT
jgi:pimeloyl-ACP methyl ester carboxylesterase